MDNFWSQKQAFCSFGRSFRIGVSSYRVHPIVWERVLAGGEFLAASRYVFGVEDAGSRGGDGLWKKLRSSTFMARFTGGANMSLVASVADIGLCALNGCRVPWRGFVAVVNYYYFW